VTLQVRQQELFITDVTRADRIDLIVHIRVCYPYTIFLQTDLFDLQHNFLKKMIPGKESQNEKKERQGENLLRENERLNNI
jgi:hypothetical protein